MSIRYLTGLFLAGLVLGLPKTVQAQLYPQGSLAVIVGFPQGEFDQKVENVGFGLDLFGGIGLGRTPVVVGIEGSFLMYGFERRRTPFSNTIPDVTVEVETSNSIALGHLVLRLQPSSGPLRPYADGLFGVKYFFTETTVKDDNFSDREIASSTNFDDAALSYGVGGGVDIQVYRGRGGKKVGAVLISAGARYLFGSEAEYLREGSIERRDGQVFFTTERSETNILITRLGVTLQF